MKLHALGASAVALTLAFSSPAVADDINKDLVGLLSISAAVHSKCDLDVNYEGIVKRSDQNGADFETYGPAVLSAVGAILDAEYDRAKLIPAVTQLVRSNLTELLNAFNRKGKAAFCKQFAPAMLNTGFMQKR
jgi:hypothetical protein